MIFGGMVRLMGAFTLASYLPDFYGQVYPDYITVCEKRGGDFHEARRRGGKQAGMRAVESEQKVERSRFTAVLYESKRACIAPRVDLRSCSIAKYALATVPTKHH